MTNLLNHTGTKLAFLLAAIACMASLVYAEGEKSVLAEESAPSISTFEPPALLPPSNAVESSALPAPQRPKVAEQQSAPTPKQSFLRPYETRRVPVTTTLSVKEESIPAPAPETIVEGPAVEVRPVESIDYDTNRRARRMYREAGEVRVSMIARNPIDGCFYEIPMCIPACCVGEPKIEGGRGLLGRGIVQFCWECGFTATVKFRPLLRDVKVNYSAE